MPTTAVLAHDCENPLASTNLFRVGMAATLEDVIQCQRLRYVVFNFELGEGLDSSARTGLDRDRFDLVCDHLMAHDTASGMQVGTYRMQSGYRAKGNLGYYGQEFFDFSPFESMRGEVLELGRACVLMGCSSLSSQNEDEGMALYKAMREKHLVEPSLRSNPVAGRGYKSNSSYTAPLRYRDCSEPIWTFPGASVDRRRLTMNSRLSIS